MSDLRGGPAGAAPPDDSESPDPAADGSGSPAEAAGAEPDPVTHRPMRLSILLAVIFLMNVAGGIKGLTSREELFRLIPGLTPTLFAVWAASPALAITGTIGLWNLRRWGLYLIGLSWAVAVTVDLIIGATNHAFLATGIMWLVVLFVRPVRAALK